jgi:Tol biopolymer transport system component
VVNDTIYYINSSNNSRLYAMNPDGTGKRKLGDEQVLRYNIAGDAIYFSSTSDEFKLYAMNLDGSGARRLSDDSTLQTAVVGDRLYFVSLNDDMMLRSIKTDGTDRWLIGENGGPWEWGLEDTADVSRGNSTGNTSNGGYVAYDPRYSSGSGRVYLSNADSGLTLHAMDLGGSAMTKLCDDYAAYINVVGDRLYYTNVSEGLEVYTIQTDGTDRRKLGDDAALYINVVGDTIYYVNASIADGYPLYAMNLDGTGRRQITFEGSYNMSQHLNVVGDLVFYVRHDTLGSASGGQIWSVRASGRNQKQLSEAHVGSLVAYGDRLYYTDLIDRQSLYSMNADGSDPRKLAGNSVICFNVAGDRIYYATATYNEGAFHAVLHSMDVDGGDRRTILDAEESQLDIDMVHSIFVAYDRLYFTAGTIGDDGLDVALYSMSLDGDGLVEIGN